MDENRGKAIFAVFVKNGRYIARYDADAAKGVLKLRKVLLDEACRLMRMHNEAVKKKPETEKRKKGEKR